MWRRVRCGAAALAVTLTLTGCETGTGPPEPAGFDAERALEDYEVLGSVLASSDLTALGGLSGRTPFASPVGDLAALAAVEPSRPDAGGRPYATELARRLLAASPARSDGAHAAPVISALRRGTTFVYDPASGDYRADPGRTGAPADGVRFILYELGGDGIPLVDEESGYADLIDEGDGSAEGVALRVRVVRDEEAVLDYRTTVVWSPGRAAITARGFIEGDRGRLDFDVELNGSEAKGLREGELLFDLAVESRGLSVAGRVQELGGSDGDSGDVELEIRHGPDLLMVTSSTEDGVLDGSVSVNGEPFAVFRGPEGDLEITAPDGSTLTRAQMRALARAVDVVEDVFDLVEDLLDPVDEIVLLGIVL